MLLIYLGVYTLFLVAVWGLFIVARLHTYKFKNFSDNIVRVTNILLFLFITLSVLGYIIIFLYSSPSENTLDGIPDISNSRDEIDLNGFDENYY